MSSKKYISDGCPPNGADGDRRPAPGKRSYDPRVKITSEVVVQNDTKALNKTESETKPMIPSRKVSPAQLTLETGPRVNRSTASLRNKSASKRGIDDEEWRNRMESWEKKKQRLSGSDWDRNFRQATPGRKKPWRVPVGPYKSHKAAENAAREEVSIDDEKKCSSSSTIRSLNFSWEDFEAVKTDSECIDDNHSLETHEEKDLDDSKEVLETGAMERESSQMTLEINAEENVVESDQQLTGHIETAGNDERTEDGADAICSTQSKRTSMSGTSRTIAFKKTILSPIQSVSEPSKSVDVLSGDGLNYVEEDDDSWGSIPAVTATKHQEVENVMKEPNVIGKPRNNVRRTHQENEEEKKPGQTPNPLPEQQFSDEYWIRVKSLLSDDDSSRASEVKDTTKNSTNESRTKSRYSCTAREMKVTNGPRQKIEEQYSKTAPMFEDPRESDEEIKYPEKDYHGIARGSNIGHKSTVSRSTNTMYRPTVDNASLTSKEDTAYCTQTSRGKHPSPKNLHHKTKRPKETYRTNVGTVDKRNITRSGTLMTQMEDTNEGNPLRYSSSRSRMINEEICRKKAHDILNSEKETTHEKATQVRERLKREVKIAKSDASVMATRIPERSGSIIRSAPSIDRLEVQRPTNRAAKALQHIIISTRKMANAAKHKHDKWNMTERHTLTMYPVRQRASLPPMFSCPDSDPMGTARRRPARPVFIGGRIASSMDDLPEPRGGEGVWYKEFHNPQITSEELESDAELTKSEGIREILIDRSGCRSSYDGPSHVKFTEEFDGTNWRHLLTNKNISIHSTKKYRKF